MSPLRLILRAPPLPHRPCICLHVLSAPPLPRPQVKVIRQEAYSYRDPVTEFIECLYVNFDFDGAQAKLAECDKVQWGGPYR